jgi:hypothetical protein
MLSFFLYMLLRRIPMLLVMIGGGAVAVARWKLHPRLSLLALLAVIFYFVEAFALLTVRYFIPDWITSMKLAPSTVNTLFTAISVLDDFAFAIIIILLVAAAFSGRRATPATTS